MSGLVVALAMAAAASVQPAAQLDQLRAAIQAEAQDERRFAQLEPAALRLSGPAARREGRRLLLHRTGGGVLVLTNDPPCSGSDDPPADCVDYRLVAWLRAEHAFIVHVGHYEGDDVLLIDDRSGRQIRLGAAIPVFGPGPGEFVTVDNDFGYGDPGIEVWKRRGDRAAPVWRLANRDPARQAAVVRWDGPDRVLLDVWNPATDRHWPGALVRDRAGWRLEVAKPPGLTPGP